MGDLQAVDEMERRWNMSVVIRVKRLQQSVREILGVFLSRGKLLIDCADLQANDAVVALMEDSLLFAGSPGVYAVDCRCKIRNRSG